MGTVYLADLSSGILQTQKSEVENSMTESQDPTLESDPIKLKNKLAELNAKN